MATEARKFQVGVFVISATIIAIAALVWLGASRFFEQTRLVVSYFQESVQGLEPGSPVKYRGVPAGRVQNIRIAPDGDLIEVLMSIDTEFAESVRADESMRAQLELAGITGLRYVEIDRHAGEALKRSPALAFEPPYEVIPSTPSSFKAIQGALKDVYDKVMGVDLAGISADTRATLQRANQLLGDERIDRILTNFTALSESGGRAAKNLDAMTGGLQLAPAVDNATRATAEARALFTELRSGPTGTQLRDTLEGVNELAQSAQQFIVGLQYTAERLDRAVRSLEGLTEEVRSQPSRLLFAEPPAPRRPADETGR